jgi:hypothetical protein
VCRRKPSFHGVGLPALAGFGLLALGALLPAPARAEVAVVDSAMSAALAWQLPGAAPDPAPDPSPLPERPGRRPGLPPDIQGPGPPFGAEPPLARFGPWPRQRYKLDDPTPVSRAVSDGSNAGLTAP